MTVREIVESRGAFVQALVDYYDHPNDVQKLMEAFALADRENQQALSEACAECNLFPTNGIFSLSALFSFMYNLGHEMWEPLKKRFEVLARLDDDVDDPYKVPIRWGS